jgi:chemotaxis protein methyltransferase CheR
MKKQNAFSYSELIPNILRSPNAFTELLDDVSVKVTEMFRDPDMFAAIRKKVTPYLKSYPHFKIWHAGCSSGEEVYSSAIMLEEEGILDKATIYGTDFNDSILKIASIGKYEIENFNKNQQNYLDANGYAQLNRYFDSMDGYYHIKNYLRDKVTFANHNLAVDGSFGEMNCIFCRNVFIYFDKELQNRVLKLFKDSLCHRGFLVLGAKETIEFSDSKDDFEVINSKNKIYRKIS